jgi:hypothetical protein
MINGLDTDSPPDLSDDFSGEEPFYVKALDLDGCGEPLYAFTGARIEGGQIQASSGAFIAPIGTGLVARNAQITGTIAPFGTTSEGNVCGLLAISDLGRQESFDETGDLSMLEVLLLGGGVMGRPQLPGLSPDVDVDGDGVERLIQDDDGRIVSCVDGDSSEISGRDCWQDSRMADGFAISMYMTDGVPAIFAGREPGWEDNVDGGCDTPPDPSLWDPR